MKIPIFPGNPQFFWSKKWHLLRLRLAASSVLSEVHAETELDACRWNVALAARRLLEAPRWDQLGNLGILTWKNLKQKWGESWWMIIFYLIGIAIWWVVYSTWYATFQTPLFWAWGVVFNTFQVSFLVFSHGLRHWKWMVGENADKIREDMPNKIWNIARCTSHLEAFEKNGWHHGQFFRICSKIFSPTIGWHIKCGFYPTPYFIIQFTIPKSSPF